MPPAIFLVCSLLQMVYSELKCCIFCYSCVQRQQRGSLINLQAYLFWMQVCVYLNIYVTPFVMALLKPPWKKVEVWPGWLNGWGMGVRGWQEDYVCVLRVLSCSFICTSLDTLQWYANCIFALGGPLTSQGNCGGMTFQFRHVETDSDVSGKKKRRRGSHAFLIAIVITFIIIIIVQTDHTQHRYPIYTIFSWNTYLKKRRELLPARPWHNQWRMKTKRRVFSAWHQDALKRPMWNHLNPVSNLLLFLCRLN